MKVNLRCWRYCEVWPRQMERVRWAYLIRTFANQNSLFVWSMVSHFWHNICRIILPFFLSQAELERIARLHCWRTEAYLDGLSKEEFDSKWNWEWKRIVASDQKNCHTALLWLLENCSRWRCVDRKCLKVRFNALQCVFTSNKRQLSDST